MTEIDMARQCGHNMEVEFINNKDAFKIGYKAFLAGLKVGKPQWHDLQKDPNDLPENKRDVWCDYGEGCGKGHYNKDNCGWWIEGHMFWSIIDAWCELPKFEEQLVPEKEAEEYQLDSNNFLLDKVNSYRDKHHLIDPEQKAISLDCALLGWHACIEWLESHNVDVYKAFNNEVEEND